MSPFYQIRDIVKDDVIASYREIMKRIVSGYENAIFLDGAKMMPDASLLCSDLVHLGFKAAKVAGKNIADAIRKEALQ